MRTLRLLTFLVLSLTSCQCFAQGWTPRFSHSVAVKELAEEEEEKGTLSSPMVLPLPTYPSEMLRCAVGGEAKIRFRVNEDGTVSNVTIVSASHKEFGEASREAVGHWKIGPILERNSPKPIKVWARCRLVFRMEDL
jgi:TonB family protein